MGRKPKYATLSTYRPYIDIICKDLELPSIDKLNLKVSFCNAHVYQNGDARYSPGLNEGKIRIYKGLSKSEIIRVLLHELKHIQQFYQHRLVYKVTKQGKKKYNVLFDGVPGNIIRGAMKGGKHLEYLNSPWEVEARAYEKEVYRLFPSLKLPETRIYVGNINGTKFYKMKG